MTNLEILSLAYQRQAAGDTRLLAEIVASVRADAALLEPPAPAPDAVVGGSRVVMPDGTVRAWEILGDGSTREVTP